MASHFDTLHVVPGLTWSAGREWDSRATVVAGQLSTGELVEVATADQAASRPIEACDTWLHGGVYEISDGARSTVVTGCDCLTPGTIAEALRRRRLQHLRAG